MDAEEIGYFLNYRKNSSILSPVYYSKVILTFLKLLCGQSRVNVPIMSRY